jgi:hypothetical protein
MIGFALGVLAAYLLGVAVDHVGDCRWMRNAGVDLTPATRVYLLRNGALRWPVRIARLMLAQQEDRP